MITVVLNGYRRQKYLANQIRCVQEQSAKVEKILIWNNGENYKIPIETRDICIANSSANFGVWSRFAYALNAETEYLCLLDDDTFPGKLFFEHCLEHMEKRPALYGARGLRFHSRNRYHPYEAFGWDAPNEEATTVDIIGHAWFFKREWLSLFWRELPEIGSSKLVGEDMHFSHMLQKYGDIPSIVPPHPVDNLEVWGSQPEIGKELGTHSVAISGQPDAFSKFDKALRYNTKNGFILYKDENKIDKDVIIGPGLSRNPLLRRVVSKNKKIEAFARSIKQKLENFGIHI